MAAYQYVYVMKNLTKAYPGGREVFKGITLSFLPTAKIGVLGPNGAGKSTLMRIMAGQDKEFGGPALAENLSVAKKALDAFGTAELRTLLNESGLGNHPEIVRLFFRAGKAISEDRVVTGSTGQAKAGPKSFSDLADVLYS